MSAVTSIEWCDRTWNCVRGCSLVSAGCRSCYAMKQAHRFSGPGKPYEGLTRLGPKGPTWTGVVRTVESALLEPLSWRKPARVFVNSMSDLFHEDVPDAFIDRVFAVMALAPRHTFQILTKRPERMRAYLAAGQFRDVKVADAAKLLHTQTRPFTLPCETVFEARPVARNEPWQIRAWPLPNVWLGVSCENQHFADERIPLLLQTPAAVRFVSAEPLLGPVNLTWESKVGVGQLSYLRCRPQPHIVNWPGLDWVIVGGESGPGARPFDLAWARSIVAQCKAAGVPVFIKQIGSNCFGMKTLSSRGYGDRKGGDPAEWPADLRVREFPAEVRA